MISLKSFRVLANKYSQKQQSSATQAAKVTPLLNNILALDSLIGFNQVMIIHHTDCGTTHFTNEGVRAVLTERDAGAAKEAGVAKIDFEAINDLPGSVARDVKFLKENKLVREELKGSIKGYLYDIEDGSLKEISA